MNVESFKPIQTNAMPRKDKVKNLVWGMINISLFRFTPPRFNIF